MKYECRECGQLYGHNPEKCDICDNTIFERTTKSGHSDGVESTQLGADVSELVSSIQNEEPEKNKGAEAKQPAGPNSDSEREESQTRHGIVSTLKSLLGS